MGEVKLAQQRRAASAASSSASLTAFRARKLIPFVPNFSALDACGAPAKTDKTCGAGLTLPAERPALFAYFVTLTCGHVWTSDPPNLDLDNPPLAPRPPPV